VYGRSLEICDYRSPYVWVGPQLVRGETKV